MRRLARDVDGTPLLGDDHGFVPLTAAHPEFGTVREALAAAAAGDLAPTDATARRRAASEIRFGRPLNTLGKLWGIGLNYADHAADLDETRPDEPASFMKPTTAVTGPGGPVRLPDAELTQRVTAEAELAVVIGRTARNVDLSEVSTVIAGYVPVIDMTAEDILERNPRYLTRAKSFDSFLAIGPWLGTGELTDLDTTEVRTVVNGETRARNVLGNMLFPPAELVAYHSRVMTLQPGDIISTGTPGAHPISEGDTISAEVDGLGSLTATVVKER